MSRGDRVSDRDLAANHYLLAEVLHYASDDMIERLVRLAGRYAAVDGSAMRLSDAVGFALARGLGYVLYHDDGICISLHDIVTELRRSARAGYEFGFLQWGMIVGVERWEADRSMTPRGRPGKSTRARIDVAELCRTTDRLLHGTLPDAPDGERGGGN